MNLANNIILNTYSIILLVIICSHAYKLIENKFLQDELFMLIIYSTLLMLGVDTLSRFDGNAESIYSIINALGNFLSFTLSPILPSLWLAYVHFQVFREEVRTRKLFYPLFAINAFNALMVILSQFYGWYYYIDSDNIYHRGQLYLLSALITIALMFVAFFTILKNSKTLEKKYFYSLIFFALPPLVSIILQIRFYGISLILNSIVISILVVFMNIQNGSIYTDHLTGVNNRKKLDLYLKKKVGTSSEEKSFSAILIDLNNFKSINDNFGHDMGDNVLETFAKLLKSCLRSDDIVARFGGDEFCIVLDISNRTDLEAMAHRIRNCIDEYNKTGSHPYELGISMGYAVYDYYSNMKAEEFLKQIDILMYKNKQEYKVIESKC